MRRIRDRGEAETEANVRKAFENYSDQKHKRRTVREYEEHLDRNIRLALQQLKDESWQPAPYTKKVIFERKRRVLAKTIVHDHVIEAAAILPYEKALYDYIAWQSPAVRPNLGTHALLRQIRNELFRFPQEKTMYYVPIDAHHYFPLMDHAILKEKVERKIKPGKLLTFIFKVIDSYPNGSPLGIKLSQILGQLYLADFDRKALRFFGIADDPEKLAYWTNRYVSDKFVSAKSPDDLAMLAKGVEYLSNRFRHFAREGLPFYTRFVDGIIIRHEDKTVVHIAKELCIMILARDYHIIVNTDYNVRPTYMGIRICGYVFFHDMVLLGKHNKKELCRHVASLRKKGLDEEQIRISQASRFGYAKHANCIHLFKSIGMEKSLGKIIKKKRIKAPFEGMSSDQKVKFSSICKTLTNVNGGGVKAYGSWDCKILLIDYKITDSKIEKTKVTVTVPDSRGINQDITKTVPGKVLAIRFKKIVKTFELRDKNGEEYERYDFEKQKDKDGNPMLEDAEFYSFTGSKILIDQAVNDFSIEDLPSPTVIQQFEGKNGQTFFKFT